MRSFSADYQYRKASNVTVKKFDSHYVAVSAFQDPLILVSQPTSCHNFATCLLFTNCHTYLACYCLQLNCLKLEKKYYRLIWRLASLLSLLRNADLTILEYFILAS
jgi:hypothetical protein